MTEFFCNRVGIALVPAHRQDEEAIEKLPMSQPLRISVKRIRNPQFHRKYMALLQFAFECWEPPERSSDFEKMRSWGISPAKSFDRFRKDVAILAGFYEATYRVNGECRIEARSISFARMDEEEFTELYSATIDVLVNKVLSGYSAEDLEESINYILEFV